MIKNVTYKLIFSAIVVGICIYGLWPPRERINLGLDLRGGMYLTLEVGTDKVVKTELEQRATSLRKQFTEQKPPIPFDAIRVIGEKITATGIPVSQKVQVNELLGSFFSNYSPAAWHSEEDKVAFELEMSPQQKQEIEDKAVQGALRTLEQRINEFGVSEPSIYPSTGAKNHIIVEMPGVETPAGVEELIQTTAQLEWRMVHPSAPSDVSRDVIMQFFGNKFPEDEYEMIRFRGYREDTEQRSEAGYIVVEKAPVITGSHLVNAQASQSSEYGGLPRPTVSFTLNSEGATRFGNVTAANVGRRIAIILDNVSISAPTVQTVIHESGQITGLRSPKEAEILALSLRSGALPATITIMQQILIGPTLGVESIHSGLLAGLLGLGIILLFMVFYYRLSGVNAIFCLLINLCLLLGFMGLVPIILPAVKPTLTLPGIAGVILTIGMGIDTNVLIFERIREELRTGKTVPASVEAGFSRAFLTIIDTHLTSIISGLVLYWGGTGPIRGFAVTLIWGLLANLFSSVFISRTLFQLEIQHRRVKKLSI